METRPLGNTGLNLPVLSFGASSLGQEFRQVDLNEALRSVQVALDLGMNFIDTSPFYGRGMSEVLLGVALRGIPRDNYILGSKLGRYSGSHFDFSARRVVESVDISLERMKVDHLDIMLCHDIEFVNMQQIIDETLPTLRKAKQAASKGSDIAKLALQFSIRNPDMATCIVGSANPKNVENWAKWAAEPVDEQLMNEVIEILKPIDNWFYIEGRPENNDPQ